MGLGSFYAGRLPVNDNFEVGKKRVLNSDKLVEVSDEIGPEFVGQRMIEIIEEGRKLVCVVLGGFGLLREINFEERLRRKVERDGIVFDILTSGLKVNEIEGGIVMLNRVGGVNIRQFDVFDQGKDIVKRRQFNWMREWYGEEVARNSSVVLVNGELEDFGIGDFCETDILIRVAEANVKVNDVSIRPMRGRRI